MVLGRPSSVPGLFGCRVRSANGMPLVGLALGDALGTTLEFSWRDKQPRHPYQIGNT